MTELWDAKDVRLEHASWRAQLLCLPGYIDPNLAKRVAFAHSALSAACHHHPYDLPPTAVEIERWLATVQSLIVAVVAVGPDSEVIETDG